MSLNKNNIKIKNKDRINKDYEELFFKWSEYDTGNIENLTFKKCDVGESNYKNLNFSKVKLDNIQCFNSSFYNCNFSNLFLNFFDSRDCTFENCTFENCTFENSCFRGSTLTRNKIINVSFADTDLKKINS